MCDLPGPETEPVSPALAGRFFTTEPPGKPSELFFRLTKINRAQSKVTRMLTITIRRLNVCLAHVTVLRPNASRTELSALVRYIYIYVFKLLSRLWEDHQEETVNWQLRQGGEPESLGHLPPPSLEALATSESYLVWTKRKHSWEPLRAGVPNLWDLMPDDVRWSWCNRNRRCTINVVHFSHPETICPSIHRKTVFHKTGPWCQKVWGPLLYGAGFVCVCVCVFKVLQQIH